MSSTALLIHMNAKKKMMVLLLRESKKILNLADVIFANFRLDVDLRIVTGMVRAVVAKLAAIAIAVIATAVTATIVMISRQMMLEFSFRNVAALLFVKYVSKDHSKFINIMITKQTQTC